MNVMEKAVRRLNFWLACLSGAALVAMMVLTVVNIVFRVAHRPFGGAVEAAGWLAALTAAFALGYTQFCRGHVAVDFVAGRFPRRLQAGVDLFTSLAGTVLFALAAWQLAAYAARLKGLGKLSETMHVSYHPFVYAVALGFASLSLALLTDACRAAKGVGGK
jgi:TRAP-type C4-dicarboxylate transport system permease small subunit